MASRPDGPIGETGKKCFGLYFGTVLQHLTHGQLKVYIQGVYPEEWKSQPDLLPICMQVVPQFAGSQDGNGVFSYPNIGATVACMFANGDQNLPLMVGSILGGPNAFGQYEHIRTNEELSSSKHLVTAGKSHVKMFEDGKISAIVVQPIRTEAKVSYGPEPDSPISVDAVESRPICEQVEANQISNINCQMVLDNSAANGTLSNSTHYFNPISIKEATILSAEQKTTTMQKTGSISTDSYSIVDNSGMRHFGQLSSAKTMTLSNVIDTANQANTIEAIGLTNDVSTDFAHDISGLHTVGTTSSLVDTYNYSYYNNASKETVLSTHNIEATGESRISQQIGTKYSIEGLQDGKFVETYVNSKTGDAKTKKLTQSSESTMRSTGENQVQINVLSSCKLVESDQKIGLTMHTNAHDTHALGTFDAEKGSSIEMSFFDKDKKMLNGTEIFEKHNNYTKMLLLTGKDPDVQLASRKQITKAINGTPKRYDVECKFDQSPTDGKIEMTIKDNMTKANCVFSMDLDGNICISSTKSLTLDVPDVVFRGTSFKAQFNDMTQIAQNMMIKGAKGDCKIKNVSLLNHRHTETQAGDVVGPQPTLIATASN